MAGDLLRLRLPALPEDVLLRHVALGELPAVARLLAARGLTPEDLARLSTDGAAPDWREVPGLQEVAQDVLAFLGQGGRLAIHGDYDVDGITGAAIALEAVRAAGHDAEVFLPHRLQDGYGLRPDTVLRLAERGVEGILTVDCGVSSFAAAEVARERGVRLWITDHHLRGERAPRAPMAHPGSLDAEHAMRWLSGAGVALQFARALIGSRAEDLVDLAALGTLADQVPLRGENRRLVRQGLERIARQPRPGLAALLRAARYQGPVDEDAVAFVLAPRLNASGRLDHPDVALRLLQADAGTAAELAQHLETLNRRRRALEQDVAEAARAQVAPGAPCAVAYGEGWHRGVIGIVAARLAEEAQVPAFVVSIEGAEAYGSARAAGGLPLLEALAAVGGCLREYGGHPGAAGFQLEAAALGELRLGLQAYYRDHPAVPEPCRVDARLRLADAELGAVDALARLRPFGPGQPAPQWLIEDAEVIEDRPIGDGSHRRMRLRDRTGEATALHWRSGAAPSAHIDLVAALESDTYQGTRRPRLRVVDRAPSAMARLRQAAVAPPQVTVGPGPAEIVDRRGMGPGECVGLIHYFTLDSLTVGRAAAAFGEGFYPAAPGEEELLTELWRSGRLRGIVGPHAVRGLPIDAVVAMERPATPGELAAAAAGRRVVLAYRPLDEQALATLAGSWAPSDDDLRAAYRRMRSWTSAQLGRPPAAAEDLVPFLVFRELGLIGPEGLGDQKVRLEDSPLLLALRRRAGAFRDTAPLWYGDLRAIRQSLTPQAPASAV